MICPVEIAGDLSALRAARVGDHAKHDLLPEGRSGAGDESTGSDFASHGEEGQVVASGRDSRAERSVDGRWRERYEEFGYDGLFDRRQGKPSPKRVPVAVVEQVLGLYRDRYFDLLRAFSNDRCKSISRWKEDPKGLVDQSGSIE
jgi:hypothetical protein